MSYTSFEQLGQRLQICQKLETENSNHMYRYIIPCKYSTPYNIWASQLNYELEAINLCGTETYSCTSNKPVTTD